MTRSRSFLFVLATLALSSIFSLGMFQGSGPAPARPKAPAPPADALKFSNFRTAPLEVAKVFGRSQGCQEADAELIEFTARTAVVEGIDPRLLAATIATESQCNPLAISKSGALGMTQVMPKVWNSKFDFSKVNLLNREQNITVGARILSGLVQQWGVTGGVTRYQGTGVGCETCDGMYTSKILTLAGRR